MLAIRTPYSSTCTDALAGLGRGRPVLPSPILRTDSAEAWWVLAAERGGREDAVELPGGGVRVRNERAREPGRPSEQREPARLHDLGHAGVRARRDRTELALTLQLGPRFLDLLSVAFRDGPKLHRREGELPAFPDSAHHHFPTSRSQ